MQRAPSPSASHSSTEGISLEKSDSGPKKKNADPKHTSAFGHADVQAQRAFSGKVSDSGDLGKKSSASAYSGLNPTSTRSASRMLSDAPPPTSKKPSGPISKRDILANSILQMDMDHELDTFTADIDCLMDSSDEEAEERTPAKGKKQGGEGGKDGSKAEEGEGGDQKKSNKGKDEGEEDDEGVSHMKRITHLLHQLLNIQYALACLPMCQHATQPIMQHMHADMSELSIAQFSSVHGL